MIVTKSVRIGLFLFLAMLLSTAVIQAAEVVAKDGEVQKDDSVGSDADEVTADSIESLADGSIKIISQTFTPPPYGKFKPFPGYSPQTHVDLQADPTATILTRVTDTADKIKVSGVFIKPTNAGDFPLQAEGNLLFSGGKGKTPALVCQGGGQGT